MRYLPVGALVGFILWPNWCWSSAAGHRARRCLHRSGATAANAAALTNTRALGDLLYTRYIFAFQAAGVILLVAMIGAIVLTLRSRVGVRHQSISAQLARTRAEAVEVVKVPIGGGVGD